MTEESKESKQEGVDVEREVKDGVEALCRTEGQVRALWFDSLTSDSLCCVAGETFGLKLYCRRERERERKKKGMEEKKSVMCG